MRRTQVLAITTSSRNQGQSEVLKYWNWIHHGCPPWPNGHSLRTKVPFPFPPLFCPLLLGNLCFWLLGFALFHILVDEENSVFPLLSHRPWLEFYPLLTEQNYLNPLRVIFFFFICNIEIIPFPNKAVGIIKWNDISEGIKFLTHNGAREILVFFPWIIIIPIILVYDHQSPCSKVYLCMCLRMVRESLQYFH